MAILISRVPGAVAILVIFAATFIANLAVSLYRIYQNSGVNRLSSLVLGTMTKGGRRVGDSQIRFVK